MVGVSSESVLSDNWIKRITRRVSDVARMRTTTRRMETDVL